MRVKLGIVTMLEVRSVEEISDEQLRPNEVPDAMAQDHW
jgi:hypothetical protein